MNADAQASIALQKAQATQIYAGLGSWPTEVMARLVAGQLTEDGTYPNAGTSFDINRGERPPSAFQANSAELIADYEGQGHDPNGWWSRGRKAGASSVKLASENEEETGGPPQIVETQKTPLSSRLQELGRVDHRRHRPYQYGLLAAPRVSELGRTLMHPLQALHLPPILADLLGFQITG